MSIHGFQTGVGISPIWFYKLDPYNRNSAEYTVNLEIVQRIEISSTSVTLYFTQGDPKILLNDVGVSFIKDLEAFVASGGSVPVIPIDSRTWGVKTTTVSYVDAGDAAALVAAKIYADSLLADLVLVAGESLSTFLAITVHSDGKVYVSSADNLGDAGKTIGITLTSASPGNFVTIRRSGLITNAAFGFTTGGRVYLGFNGTLVQTLGIGLFEQPLGVALSGANLLVEIGDATIYA